MKKQPDMLLFMSDQHAAWYTGFESGLVYTPNLYAIADRGVYLQNMYTPCPLCVPARMSFLSGKLASKTGILTNNDTLPDLCPTFLHTLVEQGYDTVLIGRMHFVGSERRHGFTKRLAKDITPGTWNRPTSQLKEERGVFLSGFGYSGALKAMGGGDSPVLQFDEYVIQEALSYLAQEHERPQFIVVGTYGPHFPYVGPPDLYRKYKEAALLPPLFGKTPDYMNACLKNRQMPATEEQGKQAMAAYLAMVETADRQVGQVKAAFDDYVQKSGRSYVFAYTSDHGDTIGDRQIFGKQTFFENSARVPFFIEGSDLPHGKVVTENVSLMDAGLTFCDLASADHKVESDGMSFYSLIMNDEAETEPRIIVSEVMEAANHENTGLEFTYGVMAKYGSYKFISYHGLDEQDMLFDLASDPQELVNQIDKHPEIAAYLKTHVSSIADPELVEKEQFARLVRNQLLRAYEERMDVTDLERWADNPPYARDYPKVQ